MPPSPPLDQNLTDAELMELEEFLSSPGLEESSLDVFGLEGFFAAVLTTPRLVKPSEWTPWIWDVDQGEISPEFETIEQAQRSWELVMRLYNSVARALLPEAGEFEPLFADGDVEAATNWCSGFVAGTRFESEAWTERIEERPKWFAPILGLGLEDDDGPPPRKGQLERWTREVGPAVTKIQAYWWGERDALEAEARGESAADAASLRTALPTAVVGRNEPCPCGSGRKYKRCCGGGSATVN